MSHSTRLSPAAAAPSEEMTPLKRAVLTIERLQARIKSLEQVGSEPIAIIGLSCWFPQAREPEAFWRLLRDGVDAITEVPAERWDVDAFYDPTPGATGKAYTRWGGFLEGIDQFDPAFFNMSPREAISTDPQQRLLMEVTWEALERAGLDPESLAGSRTGVFVGISSHDYATILYDNQPRLQALERVSPYSSTGNAFSIAANRLSYSLDLQGPSLAVDTACSSSLVTVHLACQSLRQREADLALAGGVNLILTPDLNIIFSHARMMSADGRCKTFDASADGYVRGEGCAMVVLKRLADAQRDGDAILAIIRGSAVNQDGRSNGLTAPNGLAQQRVIQDALAQAQVSPEEIDYIEAHGTGTILGDPIEVQALGAVMRDRPLERPLLIGSVKTNIGHLEAAAGIAGLIKVVLALVHEQIPAHLHFQKINPYIPLDQLPIAIASTAQPWPRGKRPRRAGVSSFGFGGTNAHVVVEEAPVLQVAEQVAGSPPLRQQLDERPLHLLGLAAKTPSALRDLAGRYVDYLQQHPDVAVADVLYTANVGRTHFHGGARLAVAAESAAQLGERLTAFVQSPQDVIAGLQTGQARAVSTAKVAFLFTGQGAQYASMGWQLYHTQPLFRRALDRCAATLDLLLPQPLLAVMGIAGDDSCTSLINETTYTQPALFALEYALAQLWRSWGIQPAYLLGHSVGEYVAACLAGAFRLEDGLRLIAERGRLMGELPHNGAMAVAFAEPSRVTSALINHPGAAIAAVNGPANVVVSGLRAEVDAVVARLEAEGVTTRPLTVSHAFHSPLMDPILERFEAAARQIAFQPLRIPVISNLTGRVMAAGEVLDAAYWRQHLRQAVQFDAGMVAVAEAGCEVFVEIGPHPALSNMGKRCLIAEREGIPTAAQGRLWLPSLNKDRPDWQVLLESLATLYVTGLDVNWVGFDEGYARRRVPLGLPTYPFQCQRYWLEPTAADWRPVRLHAPAVEPDSVCREDTPVFQHGGNGQVNVGGLETAGRPALTRELLLATEPSERRALLASEIGREIARVVGQDPTRIATEQRLNTLGLDSIMAIELKNAVAFRFQVDLPIAFLLQGPSIVELADMLLDQLSAPVEEDRPRLRPVGVEAQASGLASPGGEALPYQDQPLSLGQRALWLQHQIAPHSVYNPAYAARVHGELNVAQLRTALQALVDRHPALRTTFGSHLGEPYQRVYAHVNASLVTVDATGWSEAELQERLGEAAYQVFDLEHGPLLRLMLFTRAAEEHILLLAAHHLVVDLWSLATLIGELGVLLTSPSAETSLSPLRVTYADFVHWQQELLASPAGERMWQYWQSQLAVGTGSPHPSSQLAELSLPTDRPRPAVQTFRGAVRSLSLGSELTQQIRAFSEQRGVTPFVTLLTAFQTLMYRYSGQEDIIVGSPTTGRTLPELNNLVGYFVNPVALRSSFAGNPSFAQLLSHVNQSVLGALANQDYPLPLLVERLRPPRDPSRTPLFQVMFVLQRAHMLYEQGLSQFAMGTAGVRMELGGLSLESVAIPQRMSPFDLTMLVADSEAELGAAIEYNQDLFDESTVERMLGHYRTLLEAVVSDAERPVASLPMLTDAEKQQLQAWSYTACIPLSDTCIHHMFEAQVDRTPNAIAVTFAGPAAASQLRELTYRELDQRANQLAHHLRRLGVKPDDLVGICVERSVEMIVGVLGVLKAGGAYVPLDPAAPQERLAHMVCDSEVTLVLTQEHLAPDLRSLADSGVAARSALICLDGDWPLIASEPMARLPRCSSGQHLAYVIYTSGSTGKPKGVLVQHLGLVNLVEAQTTGFAIDAGCRVLQFASFSFDASVSEIFMALTTGATLVMVPQETVLSPESLTRTIREHAITTITLPPTVLHLLEPADLPGLTTLISAGEACTPALVRRWSANGRRVFNAYGPSEATIGPTYFDARQLPADAVTVPIGRPIPNIDVYVMDDHLQPVPPGMPGELLVGGICLARGYLGLPELTAAKFVLSPFAQQGGSRLYRTGDLVRFLPDGNLEFLGRVDNQVKIRGFRVEVEEIEAALISHPGVREAAVVARDDPETGDKRLIAYVVPATNGAESGQKALNTSELRSFLKRSLPEYMAPSVFILIDKFPLSSNGKVDRRALPAPNGLYLETGAEYVQPRTELEETLARLWSEALGITRVGIHDNFFDIGGHSLLMAKVHSALQEAVNREIPIVELFRYPTISALAAHLSQQASEPSTVERGQDRAEKQKTALAEQRRRMQELARQRSPRPK